MAVLVLPAASFVTPPAGASEPTAGGIGLRLLDVPAAAAGDPRAQVYVVDHLAPGTEIHRRVEVSNTTDAVVDVLLYAAAATIEGGAFLGADGHTRNDLSTWSSMEPGALELAPGERATATVTVEVPTDAAPGEQYGVVWAEARSGGAGVVQVSRVGIRLYLSIGPGGPPPADFTIDALTAIRDGDGHPTVLATVHNTGGRALDMSGTLELLDGPGGLRAGPFPATVGVTLGLDETARVAIELDDQLPAGPWDARITLHSGTVERSARATITFPQAGAAPSVGRMSPGSGPRTVSASFAGAGIALASGLLVHLARSRARRPSAP